MKIVQVIKPVNLIIARSMACKYEKMFRRARRLYVFMNKEKLYKNPEIIIEMAKHGCDRGLWFGNENQARQSILNNLYRIENPIINLHNHTMKWNNWINNSLWYLPEALPK